MDILFKSSNNNTNTRITLRYRDDNMTEEVTPY